MTAKTPPKQTDLATRPEEEGGISLVRPTVWLSRVFPGVKVAVTVAQVQVLCRSKHGPPSVEEAMQFVLFCAGWGVDPRIGQAYMIPFEEESASGKKYVVWQKGLAYDIFKHFAEQTGVVLGDTFVPPVKEWPEEFDPNFYVEIVISRRPPLLPIVYGARLGKLAQMKAGKLARAWATGKVGWEHMAQVRLIGRGYRLATGLSRAYLKEEFPSEDQAEPELPEGYEEALIVPSAEEVEATVAAAIAEEETALEGAPEEATPEQGAAQEEVPPGDPAAQEKLPAEQAAPEQGEEAKPNPWVEEGSPPEAEGPKAPKDMSEQELLAALLAECVRVCGSAQVGWEWLRKRHGSGLHTVLGFIRGARSSAEHSLEELRHKRDGELVLQAEQQ